MTETAPQSVTQTAVQTDMQIAVQTDVSEPRRRSCIAPILATFLTLPGLLVSWALVGISPMACDSCNEEEGDQFTNSFDIAVEVWTVSGALTLALLVMAWVPPTPVRRSSVPEILSLLAPLAALLSWGIFYAIVDWPA
ncbi:hypothetical protein HUT18_13755 [Streptomyces sp. NA04227]|uniref:hypothetical protein n=1 Tax=Streptomyces sp. NA04227 TaxID=2742136 RepID=UPI00159177FA|nr:hypothetical protein [Streptomyces sp. NA04227]QKW07298.1 hypothetical protein HUT18_13755 [Streptomyces sp. NA04227]